MKRCMSGRTLRCTRQSARAKTRSALHGPKKERVSRRARRAAGEAPPLNHRRGAAQAAAQRRAAAGMGKIMFRWEYGVDLGTSRISIACPEKSCSADRQTCWRWTGAAAGSMRHGGRGFGDAGPHTPWIEVYQPVEKGLVSRPELAALLLKNQFRAVRPNNPVASSRLCLCTPVSATGVGRTPWWTCGDEGGHKACDADGTADGCGPGRGAGYFCAPGKMVIEIRGRARRTSPCSAWEALWRRRALK